MRSSVLGVPSPAVTPTNLLYNVFSTPGGLMRFAREGCLRGPLSGPARRRHAVGRHRGRDRARAVSRYRGSSRRCRGACALPATTALRFSAR
jgi:hypothetical protein